MMTVSAYSDPVTILMAPGVWRFYGVPFAFMDGSYGLLEYNEVYDPVLRQPCLASLNLNLLDAIDGQPRAEISMP